MTDMGVGALASGAPKPHRTEAAKALTKPLERLGGTFPVLVGFRFLFLKLPLRIPQLMEVEHGVFFCFFKGMYYWRAKYFFTSMIMGGRVKSKPSG